jgi:O-methyltransferase involved in polyketide biosynthesis
MGLHRSLQQSMDAQGLAQDCMYGANRAMCVVTHEEAAVFAAAASMSAERDEPWLTRLRPNELISKLTALGFSQVARLSPEAANDRYFREHHDDLAAWSAAQMMRAIV